MLVVPTWALRRQAIEGWSTVALTLTSTGGDTKLTPCTTARGLGQTNVVHAAHPGFISVAVIKYLDNSNWEGKRFIFLQFQVTVLYQMEAKAGT